TSPCLHLCASVPHLWQILFFFFNQIRPTPGRTNPWAIPNFFQVRAEPGTFRPQHGTLVEHSRSAMEPRRSPADVFFHLLPHSHVSQFTRPLGPATLSAAFSPCSTAQQRRSNRVPTRRRRVRPRRRRGANAPPNAPFPNPRPSPLAPCPCFPYLPPPIS